MFHTSLLSSSKASLLMIIRGGSQLPPHEMETPTRLLLPLLLVFTLSAPSCSSSTYPPDASALRSLMEELKNMPPRWGKSDDPCGSAWEGVHCTNSRVTKLVLFNMGLEGGLSQDIGNLTQLQELDLSSNKKLGGPLTPAIGKLTQLTSLKLLGCSFSGSIPDELGNLAELSYIALNSNNFTGEIPASLGKLSKLFFLDLAENRLRGRLPTSTNGTPGLDQLISAVHFHLNENQLSGSIPDNLFSANMPIKHILLDRNLLVGAIPDSVGLLPDLEILRLNNNNISGPVPANITSLTKLHVLNLANNNLSGQMPDLSGMAKLSYVDLSNNTFNPSEAPSWFSDLQNLKTLVIESGSLQGPVPQGLFSITSLQEVLMGNNSFNGTLDMGNNISQRLKTVDFQHNALTAVTLSSNYINTLTLAGNPLCNNPHLLDTSYCQIRQESSSAANASDNCSHPYQGLMVFRAPFYRDVANNLTSLENSVLEQLNCASRTTYLQNLGFDDNGYLSVRLKLCPEDKKYFNRTEVLTCFDLSSQNYSTPGEYGPYYFNADEYPFPSRAFNKALVIGVVVGCSLLIVALVCVSIYALQKKKQAQRAISLSNPFASWQSTGEDNGDAPKLSGAKCFSYDELRKSTNGFREINEIGSGGYGKVYRGMLPDGQVVAIKRSSQDSMQGSLEFKTEIELLSRVHHKNLVGLVGFCFERGERMLVYEFICNGSLRQSLSGMNGIELNWKRRLWVALDSARGLAYLHEHANPPIIHRDVKSANILLDENLTAKVADFGLSMFVSNSETGHVTANIKGTLGYLDPEYYTTQQLTGKSDVYSFGVVMLELITGKLPIHHGKYIVREVKTALDMQEEEYCGLKDLIDPVIRNKYLIGLQRFLELALQCVKDSAADRPTMSEVVKEIEAILQSNEIKTTSISASPPALELSPMTTVLQYHHDYPSSSRTDFSGGAFEYSGGFPSHVSLKPRSM